MSAARISTTVKGRSLPCLQGRELALRNTSGTHA